MKIRQNIIIKKNKRTKNKTQTGKTKTKTRKNIKLSQPQDDPTAAFP